MPVPDPGRQPRNPSDKRDHGAAVKQRHPRPDQPHRSSLLDRTRRVALLQSAHSERRRSGDDEHPARLHREVGLGDGPDVVAVDLERQGALIG